MDRAEERLNVAVRVLEALRVALAVRNPGELERDATLLRLAFAAEASWKAAQIYLRSNEGIEVASPKSTVRACVSSSLLAPDLGEAALRLLDDRNLIVHTYNEDLAAEILARCPVHERSLTAWLQAIGWTGE